LAGTAYFYIVTAANSAGESGASVEATASTNGAAIDGLALYTQYCSGCHGASGKRGRTAAQISDAIANIADMNGIALTQAQIAAIAAARP
jgi:mono/diheme cytochrome c family protein